MSTRKEKLEELIESKMSQIVDDSVAEGRTVKEAEELAMVETIGVGIDFLCDELDALEARLFPVASPDVEAFFKRIAGEKGIPLAILRGEPPKESK